MHRILGLGALGLFLIAGSAPAQQPATNTGPVSTPVVQSGVVTTSDAPTNRRFGIFRGNRFRRGNVRNNNVVQPISQARVETAATQQPGVETIKAMPTEKTTVKPDATKTTTTETAVTSTPTTTTFEQPTSNTSNRRFFRGNFRDRLASRFGR
jgi:hypothetical protein